MVDSFNAAIGNASNVHFMHKTPLLTLSTAGDMVGAGKESFIHFTL